MSSVGASAVALKRRTPSWAPSGGLDEVERRGVRQYLSLGQSIVLPGGGFLC